MPIIGVHCLRGLLGVLQMLFKLLGGGSNWWEHREFTRTNIAPIIRENQIEDLMNVKGIGEKSFLKLKPLITVASEKSEKAGGAR